MELPEEQSEALGCLGAKPTWFLEPVCFPEVEAGAGFPPEVAELVVARRWDSEWQARRLRLDAPAVPRPCSGRPLSATLAKVVRSVWRAA